MNKLLFKSSMSVYLIIFLSLSYGFLLTNSIVGVWVTSWLAGVTLGAILWAFTDRSDLIKKIKDYESREDHKVQSSIDEVKSETRRIQTNLLLTLAKEADLNQQQITTNSLREKAAILVYEEFDANQRRIPKNYVLCSKHANYPYTPGMEILYGDSKAVCPICDRKESPWH